MLTWHRLRSRRADDTMSPPTYQTLYHDHLLSFRPLVLDDGRYQARVAIAALGGIKTRTQRFLDLQTFDSHDEAVACARQAGISWVDRQLASAARPGTYIRG